MKIRIKKLNENATIPTRGSEYAAGYDLYAAITEAVTIEPHHTVKIGTGISIELPDGTFGGVYPRSGISSKRGLRPANCVGVCDSDYRGEVIVALHNDSNIPQTVEPNERIAQYIVQQYISVEWEETDELSETDRGTGGFGSTGA